MEENNDQSTESADVQQSHAETAATTLPAGQVEPIALDPAARFRGNGASFKAKLIGIDDVPESRGDKMCQESILKLKGAVKASGQHKPKIMVNVSMKGLRIINLMNGEIEHEHPVHRISFIARDLTDRRAFGYVYGAGEGKHKFFGIKTAKIAENLVLALRDLFQVVYDEKKKEMEEAKQKQSENGEEGTGNSEEVYAVPNNRPVPQQRNLLDIQQQLDNMHEIRASDAFNPWPENAPVSPDTPGSPLDSDMFGMQNLSDISSLSSDFSMASASGVAPEYRPNESKLPRCDSRTEQFRRTSSGKSVGSTGTHHWPGFRAGRKMRQGSLSGSNDSKESTTTVEKAQTGKQSLSATPIKKHSEKDVRTDQSEPIFAEQTNANSKQATKDTGNDANELEAQEESFFNEVMTATGLSKDATHSGSANSTKQASDSPKLPNGERTPIHDTAEQDPTGSLSSVSSASSKSATPRKTLSISNLFFSARSEKRRSSSKRKGKRSQTPNEAVVSSPEQPSGERRRIALPDQVSTSSRGSGRARRTSSSSSVASVDRVSSSKLSRGYSSTSIASVPDLSSSTERSYKDRVPPPASIARARPKVRSSMSMRVSSKDNHNPPMFKFKHQVSADNIHDARALRKHNSVSSLDSAQSLHSLNSPTGTIVEQNETTDVVPSQKQTESDACQSWAHFDDSPSTQDFDNAKNKLDERAAEKDTTLDDVWASACSGQDAAAVNDPAVSSGSVPNAFQESFSNFPVAAGFDADPFGSSNFGGSSTAMHADSPFENSDPFGDIELEDPLADPLKDVEELFGPLMTEQAMEGPCESGVNQDAEVHKHTSRQSPLHEHLQDDVTPETVDHNSASSSADDPGRGETPSPIAASVHSSSDLDSKSPSLPRTLTPKVPSFPPPPLPPRPPRRVSSPEAAETTLPPAIPPPLPPPRPDACQEDGSIAGVIEESSDSESDSCDVERFSLPPESEPPKLPCRASSPPPVAQRACPPVPSRNQSQLVPTGASSDEAEPRTKSPISSDFSADKSPTSSDVDERKAEVTAIVPKLKPPPPQSPPKAENKKQNELLLGGPNDDFRSNSSFGSFCPLSNRSDQEGYLASSSPNGNQQTGVPRGSSADDLAAIFSSEASQPAPAPGAKMTKDQILAGFVTAPSAMPGMQHGMYQQTPAFGAQPSYGAAAQPGYGAAAQPGYGAAAQPGYGAAAQPGYGAAAQPGYGAAARPGFGVAAQPQMSNPFNSGLAAGQSAYGQPAMGMFPSGPSPAVPARPGAMRPPTAVPAQTGAAQNPFGDALVPSANLLAPQSSYPVAQQNGSGGNDIAEKNDPFASLLPGIGSGSGSGSSNATNKKDMFKNFQMAKPAPPPRSGENVSANFENYMRNTVGGVPLQSDVTNSNPLAAAAPPVAAPRSTAADPFGGAPSSGTAGNGNDPFGMFNSPSSNFDQPFNFSNQQPPAANTQQSLFG